MQSARTQALFAAVGIGIAVYAGPLWAQTVAPIATPPAPAGAPGGGGGSGGGGGAGGAATQSTAADSVKNLIDITLSTQVHVPYGHVTSTTTTLPNGQTGVYLSGVVARTADKAAVVKAVTAIPNTVVDSSALVVDFTPRGRLIASVINWFTQEIANTKATVQIVELIHGHYGIQVSATAASEAEMTGISGAAAAAYDQIDHKLWILDSRGVTYKPAGKPTADPEPDEIAAELQHAINNPRVNVQVYQTGSGTGTYAAILSGVLATQDEVTNAKAAATQMAADIAAAAKSKAGASAGGGSAATAGGAASTTPGPGAPAAATTTETVSIYSGQLTTNVPGSVPGTLEALVRTAIDDALQSRSGPSLPLTVPQVTVKSQAQPGGTTIISLSGFLDTSAQVSTAIAAAQASVPPGTLLVSTGLRTYDPITRVWPLSFLRSDLPDITGTTSTVLDATGLDNAAKNVAAVLSSAVPGLTVNPLENNLVIVGQPNVVQRTRELLALRLDVPSAQIRADVLTVQMNSSTSRPSSTETGQTNMDTIRAGIQLTSDIMKQSRGLLGKYIAGDPQVALSAEDTGLMKLVGYDPNPHRVLSVVDILVLLTYVNQGNLKTALTPGRTRASDPPLVAEFATVLDHAEEMVKAPQSSKVDNNARRSDLQQLIKRIRSRVDAYRIANLPLLPRIVDAYQAQVGINGIHEFLDAWINCEKAFDDTTGTFKPIGIDVGALPDRLARKSAVTDSMLKAAMDGLSADMNDLFVSALMDWIRVDVQRGSATLSGINLVGTTSLVVRSRTLGSTTGTSETYTKFTPHPTLSLQDLTNAQSLIPPTPAPAGGTAAAPSAPAGGTAAAPSAPSAASTAITLFKTLSPLEALGMVAVQNENQTPFYSKLAPGISLAIRPFVLPDGGSARIQLNLSTTLNASQPTPGKEAQQGAPVDLVDTQSTKTEATVDSFELLEISSFGSETTRPGDPQWRIPFLNQIPVLGPLFQGPARHETHRQESMAVITLSILPRSIDLVPYLTVR